MGKTVQYIVYAVTMCVIYAVIGHLNNRNGTGSDSGDHSGAYPFFSDRCRYGASGDDMGFLLENLCGWKQYGNP